MKLTDGCKAEIEHECDVRMLRALTL